MELLTRFLARVLVLSFGVGNPIENGKHCRFGGTTAKGFLSFFKVRINTLIPVPFLTLCALLFTVPTPAPGARYSAFDKPPAT